MTNDISFLLDLNGDVAFETDEYGNVDIQLVEDEDELIQSIIIAMKTRINEDIISPQTGLPLKAIIEVSDPDYIAGAIARALRRDDRVTGVRDTVVSIDRAIRKADVSMIVSTIYGDTEVDTELST